MIPLLVLLVVSALCAGAPRPLGAQQTGAIVATVVAKGTDVGLGYSVISIASLSREQFTDATGRTVLDNLPPGHWSVRAKHIGFLPVDVAVDVRPGDTVRVRMELGQIAVLLPPVRTVASACTKPGAPLPEADSTFALVFEQVKQNAERNRLITRSYPYQYTVQRVESKRHANGAEDTVNVLTQTNSSTREWRYHPGDIVQQARVATGPKTVGWTTVFMLPELADFADDEFIRNHCFRYAGVQDVDGGRLLRVDFEPSVRIRDPDIAGSLYLDTASYQLRRADQRLTNLTRDLAAAMTGISATTIFREVVPGVAIMDQIVSETSLPPARNRDPWVAALTYQHATALIWLKAKP